MRVKVRMVGFEDRDEADDVLLRVVVRDERMISAKIMPFPCLQHDVAMGPTPQQKVPSEHSVMRSSPTSLPPARSSPSVKFRPLELITADNECVPLMQSLTQAGLCHVGSVQLPREISFSWMLKQRPSLRHRSVPVLQHMECPLPASHAW